MILLGIQDDDGGPGYKTCTARLLVKDSRLSVFTASMAACKPADRRERLGGTRRLRQSAGGGQLPSQGRFGRRRGVLREGARGRRGPRG